MTSSLYDQERDSLKQSDNQEVAPEEQRATEMKLKWDQAQLDIAKQFGFFDQ